MGACQSKDEHFGAWVSAVCAPIIRCMTSDRLDDHATALLDAARDLQEAASERGSSDAATAALGSLETALQALSGAWYQVAADAVPRDPRAAASGHGAAEDVARRRSPSLAPKRSDWW